MFKKNPLGVTQVLFLAVILAFTGCPTSSGGNISQEYEEEPQYPPPPPVPRPKEIVAENATVSDINSQLSSSSTSKVTLTAGSEETVTVTTDAKLEVPAGKALEIGANVTLEVPGGQTAEIKGNVAVASGGTLDFSGLTDAKDQVALTGTITVESGGIFMMKNSTTPNQSSVAYDGGKLVLKQGSTAYLDSTLFIGSAGDNAPFQWASSGSGTTIEFSSNADDINIITLKGGEITVKGATTPVMAAVIAENAALTVDPATTFVVVISLEVKGTLKADKPIRGLTAASTITFDSGATLSGDYVGTTSGNFYPNGEGTDKEAAAAGKTYTWALDAGGKGTAGWKADS